MYKIRLTTNVGFLFLESNTKNLPIGEFIKCKNQDGEVIYINRNQVLFYTIRKVEGKN